MNILNKSKDPVVDMIVRNSHDKSGLTAALADKENYIRNLADIEKVIAQAKAKQAEIATNEMRTLKLIGSDEHVIECSCDSDEIMVGSVVELEAARVEK